MNVVFDTNILISSTLWNGSVSQRLLFKLIDKDVTIYSSKEILNEFKKVLRRDFEYTDEEIINIMECAIASNSKYIITFDKKHLLILKEYKGIQIITPEEMLKII